MKCLDCGMDYVGMKKHNKYNCPHCSVVDVRTGEVQMFVIKGIRCIDCERDIYYNATKDLYVCRICDR